MKKIMAIDDDPMNLELFRAVFEDHEEVDLKCVESGKQALKTIEEFSPDYILLDLMMPEMDGFEVCSRIRKQSLKKQPKIIVITGKLEDDLEEKAYARGCDSFYYKPFDLKTLLKEADIRL